MKLWINCRHWKSFKYHWFHWSIIYSKPWDLFIKDLRRLSKYDVLLYDEVLYTYYFIYLVYVLWYPWPNSPTTFNNLSFVIWNPTFRELNIESLMLCWWDSIFNCESSSSTSHQINLSVCVCVQSWHLSFKGSPANQSTVWD